MFLFYILIKFQVTESLFRRMHSPWKYPRAPFLGAGIVAWERLSHPSYLLSSKLGSALTANSDLYMSIKSIRVIAYYFTRYFWSNVSQQLVVAPIICRWSRRARISPPFYCICSKIIYRTLLAGPITKFWSSKASNNHFDQGCDKAAFR